MTDDNTMETQTFEEALDAGFWGLKEDPEPNSTYTVEGVTAAPAAKSKASTTKATTSSGSTSAPSGTTSTGS
jgi:hypothetical protein